MNNSDKHTFAIYVSNISALATGLKVDQELQITERDLHQRIAKVLRLKSNESVILFNDKINVELQILSKTFENKKTVFGSILKIEQNKPLSPEIILCPFLLKKSFFEDVVYTAAQMGANFICPILGEKVQAKINWEKESERLHKIMIAACEQSKNFVLPKLQEPEELKTFLSKIGEGKKIYFDVDGKPLFDLLKDLHQNKSEKIFLVFGPESGLAEFEIDLLKSNDFQTYLLTPTILRAVEAVTVGLGIIRSI